MITSIYEIQTPYEAEALIESGVDNINSVITSERSIKQLIPKVSQLNNHVGYRVYFK